MNKQQTYAEQLRQVRDSLTNENWLQGSYFISTNHLINGNKDKDRVCMCVHAAAQKIVNPEVRAVFASRIKNTKELAAKALMAVSPVAAVSLAAHENVKNISSTKSKNDILRKAWQQRPDYVRASQDEYGETNIHWLMGMFGITVQFNDDPNTTLDMIKDRLTKAADWAEKNEQFLLF